MIVEVQVFYGYPNEMNRTTESVKEQVEGQDTPTIKLQVGRIIREIRQTDDDTQYYYVVIKVTKSDGKYGYRTIIGKTFFKGAI